MAIYPRGQKFQSRISQPSTGQTNFPIGAGAAGFGRRTPSAQPQFSFKEAYPASVEQQAEDYDELMGGYRDAISGTGSFDRSEATKPLDYNPITPESYNYNRSSEVGEAFNKLRGLSETGGYEPGELAALRERGISPIRAIYANAMQNVSRQRALGGGYSPNYNAVAAKMAREQSGQLSDATTRVNADIAERVAAGRQAAIPQFANFAGGESELANRYGSANTEARNRAAEINAARKLEVDKSNRAAAESEAGNKFQALEGMKSLYGTTPALVNTFGQQAAQAAQLEQGTKQNIRNTGLSMIGGLSRRTPSSPNYIPILNKPGINPKTSPLRSPLTGRVYGGG